MAKSEKEGGVISEKRPSFNDGRQEFTVVTLEGEVVNASGHRDQLKRQYGLLAICGLALTVDNAWVVLGLSLSISIGKRTATSEASTVR